MKIRPVILCGGAGTRLWPKAKKHQAKQFIDFGNWTLLGKTLERVKASIYDAPIISTNAKYLKQVKQHLKQCLFLYIRKKLGVQDLYPHDLHLKLQ